MGEGLLLAIIYFIMFLGTIVYKSGISNLTFIIFNLFCVSYFLTLGMSAGVEVITSLFFIFMTIVNVIEFIKRFSS